MRLDDVRSSDNVEDRRSAAPVAMAGGGVGLLLLIGFVLLRGGNLGDVINVVQQQQQQQVPGGGEELSPEEEARKQQQIAFVQKIVALTEDVWIEQFRKQGLQYPAPKLVVFRGATQTACGVGQQAMGPFYCPADQQVYIDLAFYVQLDRELNAPGDFAQAYVIAHEVGHHIQKQLGYSDKVHQARQLQSEADANENSVRLELQADYLAGVWAHHAQRQSNVLETGDIEEGLRAARQIGDDMLQKQATGRIVPENFTHGTSAQRMRWLKEGLRTGDFSPETLDQFFELRYEQL
ncbi:MAG: neutral zinc metallopeptidase [Planctomycetaceae bacterium]